MNVGDIDPDGFEGLYDFDSASTCRNVDAAHFKHLHEWNHGAGGDSK